MTERRVRICRVLMMEGPESWVNETLRRSIVQPNAPKDFLIGKISEPTRIREIIKEGEDGSKD